MELYVNFLLTFGNNVQRTGELRLCEKLRDFGWSNVATLDRADQQTRLAKTQEHAMRAKNGGGEECVIECNLPRVENCESRSGDTDCIANLTTTTTLRLPSRASGFHE